MSLNRKQIEPWPSTCKPAFGRVEWPIRLHQGGGDVKLAMTGWMVMALLLVGFSVGRASDKDETVVTVQVNSADHEVQEGYFALGEQATVMVKPGSDLYQFLTRQRGRKVKIVLTEAATAELSKIER